MASTTRQLVSYDDITLPYTAGPPPPPRTHSPKPPPAKKRKWNSKPKGRHRDGTHYANGSNFTQNSTSHSTNGPGSSSMQVDYDDENTEDGEESRDLTHDEIWDDSALIDAWNAATEEYEAYNGPDKGWKKEPEHKSPLWYNIPPAPEKKKGKSAASAPTGPSLVSVIPETKGEDDSEPVNFDTFVPSHDPSLDLPIHPPQPPAPGLDNAAYNLSNTSGQMVSQDEAFSRALGAMYWTGYWTAMYHCQRNVSQSRPAEDMNQIGEDVDEFEEEDEEDEAFVSTQR